MMQSGKLQLSYDHILCVYNVYIQLAQDKELKHHLYEAHFTNATQIKENLFKPTTSACLVL